MRQFLSENCLDKLIQLAIGLGVVGAVGATGGAATAIGAGQLAVGGLAGLGAVAAGRAIKDRIKEDEVARHVFEAVTQTAAQVWIATGSEDAGIAREISQLLDDNLERIDFPITDIRAIHAAAGRGDGLYAALADGMLARLDDPFGVLAATPRHRELARDILSDAARAGVQASDTLLKQTILDVTDLAVRFGRQTLAATREEGAATRAAVAEEGAATRDAMAAMEARLMEKFEGSARATEAGEAHLTRAAIIQLARRIARDVADFDTALAELDRAVSIAIEVMEDAARFGNVGAVVEEVLKRMAGLSGLGRHDEAAALADRAFENWQQAEQERQDAARQQGLALLEAGLKQDILRRDAHAAASRIVRRLDLENPPDGRFAALAMAVEDWLDRGRDQGLNFDLEVAIALARQLRLAATGPDQSGAAWVWLGNALSTLGERESGTGRLEEAVTAYGAALKEYTRERVPLDWAMTQNNLGNALQTLGRRENGTGRLEEAVAAYRAALEERTRERVPLNWAMTQNNLGSALQTLGRRESGTGRLEEAVAAYGAALEERTRERVPLGWAATQNNLGSALQTLGWRESGTGRLEEAVDAYGAALKEYTRERVPLDWAMTTGNRAEALSLIASRTGDCGLARQAVADLEAVVALVEAAGHGPFTSYYRGALERAQAIVAEVCG